MVEPAGRGNRGDGILEGRPRDDLPGGAASFDEIHYELAAALGRRPFPRIRGWDVVDPHRRDAESRHGSGHRVGRELSAAGAGTGASDALEGVELFLAHDSGGTGADGFEHVLNSDIFSLVPARHDRASVEH